MPTPCQALTWDQTSGGLPSAIADTRPQGLLYKHMKSYIFHFGQTIFTDYTYKSENYDLPQP